MAGGPRAPAMQPARHGLAPPVDKPVTPLSSTLTRADRGIGEEPEFAGSRPRDEYRQRHGGHECVGPGRFPLASLGDARLPPGDRGGFAAWPDWQDRGLRQAPPLR